MDLNMAPTKLRNALGSFFLYFPLFYSPYANRVIHHDAN